jgi:hypothetical protein
MNGLYIDGNYSYRAITSGDYPNATIPLSTCRIWPTTYQSSSTILGMSIYLASLAAISILLAIFTLMKQCRVWCNKPRNMSISTLVSFLTFISVLLLLVSDPQPHTATASQSANKYICSLFI